MDSDSKPGSLEFDTSTLSTHLTIRLLVTLEGLILYQAILLLYIILNVILSKKLYTDVTNKRVRKNKTFLISKEK